MSISLNSVHGSGRTIVCTLTSMLLGTIMCG